MREYLAQLSPEWCEAVIASGGEPLLDEAKLKELFSLVPPTVHKKVMTNGGSLTQALVDYFNALDIEVALSHDGAATEVLRGYDVLKDEELTRLIRGINRLTVCGVCTNKNPNPWANFEYTSALLGRNDFNYLASPIFEDSYFAPLVDGFDYAAYCVGRFLLWTKRKNPPQKYVVTKARGEGVNVLPDGRIVGMTRINHVYGTVESTFEELHRAKAHLGDSQQCNKTCMVASDCKCPTALASEHYCKIQYIDSEVKRFINDHLYS